MIKKAWYLTISFIILSGFLSCSVSPKNKNMPGASIENAIYEAESLSGSVLDMPLDGVTSATSRQIVIPWGYATAMSAVIITNIGISSNCFYFNGVSNSYVDVPNNGAINFGTGDFTLACWLKTTNTATYNTIIEKRNPVTSTGYHFILYRGHILLQLATTANWANFWGGDGAPVFNDGKWHFIAVTVDRDSSTGLKMYADGSLVHTFNPSAYSASIDNISNLLIGKHMNISTGNFIGLLDDVKLYKALLNNDDLDSISGISAITNRQTKLESWTAHLKSIHRNESYAKYYTFTLTTNTTVKINLNSTVDTFLYLLSGRGADNTVIKYDDDGGEGYNSEIVTNLPEGNYTIEATTYSGGVTGSFSLTLSCNPFKTRHVVVLVMDGARYTETWGNAGHQYIPKIASELAPQGAVLTAFSNSGYTETTAGHTAMTTGVNQNISNDGSEYPQNPSIMHYLLKQYISASNLTWVIASKDKLHVLSQTKTPGWTSYNPSIDCGVNGNGTGGYRDDSVTFSNACARLTNLHPGYTIINLKDPDSCGHASNWSGYLAAITNIDASASILWKLINSDAALSNKTTLFIVNDHGRHTTDYVSHGDSCEGCRHIMCVTLGPDFKANIQSSSPYDLRDVAATSAYLLNVNMPTSAGKIMYDIFK